MLSGKKRQLARFMQRIDEFGARCVGSGDFFEFRLRLDAARRLRLGAGVGGMRVCGLKGRL